jgi:hypothetical protein
MSRHTTSDPKMDASGMIKKRITRLGTGVAAGPKSFQSKPGVGLGRDLRTRTAEGGTERCSPGATAARRHDPRAELVAAPPDRRSARRVRFCPLPAGARAARRFASSQKNRVCGPDAVLLAAAGARRPRPPSAGCRALRRRARTAGAAPGAVCSRPLANPASQHDPSGPARQPFELGPRGGLCGRCLNLGWWQRAAGVLIPPRRLSEQREWHGSTQRRTDCSRAHSYLNRCQVFSIGCSLLRASSVLRCGIIHRNLLFCRQRPSSVCKK